MSSIPAFSVGADAGYELAKEKAVARDLDLIDKLKKLKIFLCTAVLVKEFAKP